MCAKIILIRVETDMGACVANNVAGHCSDNDSCVFGSDSCRPIPPRWFSWSGQYESGEHGSYNACYCGDDNVGEKNGNDLGLGCRDDDRSHSNDRLGGYSGDDVIHYAREDATDYLTDKA